jgi:hypothetical protein
MIADPWSMSVPMYPTSSFGRRSAIHTTRLRPSPSAKHLLLDGRHVGLSFRRSEYSPEGDRFLAKIAAGRSGVLEVLLEADRFGERERTDIRRDGALPGHARDRLEVPLGAHQPAGRAADEQQTALHARVAS